MAPSPPVSRPTTRKSRLTNGESSPAPSLPSSEPASRASSKPPAKTKTTHIQGSLDEWMEPIPRPKPEVNVYFRDQPHLGNLGFKPTDAIRNSLARQAAKPAGTFTIKEKKRMRDWDEESVSSGDETLAGIKKQKTSRSASSTPPSRKKRRQGSDDSLARTTELLSPTPADDERVEAGKSSRRATRASSAVAPQAATAPKTTRASRSLAREQAMQAADVQTPTTNGVTTPAASSPPATEATRAHESDSDLSSVNEEIIQAPPPAPLTGTSSRADSVSQPSSRRGSRAPVQPKAKSHVNGKTEVKREKTSAEELALEEAERDMKRAKYYRDFKSFEADIPTTVLRSTGSLPNNRDSSPLSSRPPTPPAAPVAPAPEQNQKQTVRSRNARSDKTPAKCQACNQESPATALAECPQCQISFHGICLDPPVVDGVLDGIMCNVCEAKGKTRHHRNEPGLMGLLISELDNINPKSFSLPSSIQNYFEDVRAGKNGEYTNSNWTTDSKQYYWQDPEDIIELQRRKMFLICHHCGEGPRPDHAIVKCDDKKCEALWHADCVDPPLYLPLPTSREHLGRRLWKCPLHNEETLRILRACQRVPKRKTAVDPPAAKKQRKNYGFIEPVEEPEEWDSGFWEEEREDGTMDKIPTKSIKLDFIAKARVKAAEIKAERLLKERLAEQQQRIEAFVDDAVARLSSSSTLPPPSHHTFKEKQAAMQLTLLAQVGTSFSSPDTVGTLIAALTAEAPDEVTMSITKEQRAAERADLDELEALIARRKAALAADEDSETANIAR